QTGDDDPPAMRDDPAYDANVVDRRSLPVHLPDPLAESALSTVVRRPHVAEDSEHAIEDPRGSGARRWQDWSSNERSRRQQPLQIRLVPRVGPTVRPFCKNLPRRATDFPSIEERSSVPPE